MNKKLLGNNKLLEILIDSKSFSEELNNGNKDAGKILKYSKVEFLKFLRSPLYTEFKELEIIPEFIEERDENGNLINIIITDGSRTSTTLFDYEMDYINAVGLKLFNKSLNKNKIDELSLIFIQSALNRFNIDNTCILITNNDFLLKKRLLFDQYTRIRTDIQKHLHILTIEEAKEFIGLFLRFQNEYIKFADPFGGQYKSNKGLWYWSLFRSNVPNFHVGALINEPFLDAFSTRFVYLLRSVDEIGFQYYKGVNNDTMDDMMYHFNYSISLITGIFDSLALITENKYNLNVNGEDKNRSKISLNPKAGKSFLKALKKADEDLRNHILEYGDVIKMVYELREDVIHRDLLDQMRFSNENKFEMNALKVNKSILMHFTKNYKKEMYKPLTEWGVYTNNGVIYKINNQIYLEPFKFIKKLVGIIILFSNEYLRLIGFEDFIEQQKTENQNDLFIRSLELIKEFSLTINY